MTDPGRLARGVDLQRGKSVQSVIGTAAPIPLDRISLEVEYSEITSKSVHKNSVVAPLVIPVSQAEANNYFCISPGCALVMPRRCQRIIDFLRGER